MSGNRDKYGYTVTESLMSCFGILAIPAIIGTFVVVSIIYAVGRFL